MDTPWIKDYTDCWTGGSYVVPETLAPAPPSPCISISLPTRERERERERDVCQGCCIYMQISKSCDTPTA